MTPHTPNQSDPPGKIKIAEALKKLLREKDFNSITTADISRTSPACRCIAGRTLAWVVPSRESSFSPT
jgi:hypothetical protein